MSSDRTDQLLTIQSYRANNTVSVTHDRNGLHVAAEQVHGTIRRDDNNIHSRVVSPLVIHNPLVKKNHKPKGVEASSTTARSTMALRHDFIVHLGGAKDPHNGDYDWQKLVGDVPNEHKAKKYPDEKYKAKPPMGCSALLNVNDWQ